MRLKNLFLTCFLFPVLLSAAPLPFKFDPMSLDWKLEPGVRWETRDGKRLLIAEIPAGSPKNTTARAVAKIPAEKFTYLPLRVSVPVRQYDITQYNGIMLQMNFVAVNGAPEEFKLAQTQPGTVEKWREWAIIPVFFAGASNATLTLGLQKTEGRVEYDMDNLVFDLLHTPPTDEDRLYQCEYSDAVKARPMQRGVMSPNRMMTDEDFLTLIDWKVNLLRFQFKPLFISEQKDVLKGENYTDYSVYRERVKREFDKCDRAMALAKKYGVDVVIDYHHTAPGGFEPGGEHRVFMDQRHVDEYKRIWKEIVTRYKGHEALWAYDLINEPVQHRHGVTSVVDLQRELAEMIREIDPETPLIVATTDWGHHRTYIFMPPIRLKNIYYNIHLYGPVEFFHAGKISYPGTYKGTPFNKEWFRRELQAVRDFQIAHGAKFYVGEFGVAPWVKGGDLFMRDLVDLFEEFQWPYTMHAFREWDGWSIEHEGESPQTLRPSADNPRKRVMLKAFSKNAESVDAKQK